VYGTEKIDPMTRRRGDVTDVRGQRGGNVIGNKKKICVRLNTNIRGEEG
jgi:hypothetical protein